MVDPESFGHGLHGFASAFEHQSLEVEAAGGSLVFADQGGKDCVDEFMQVTLGVGGGFRVHNQTLCPRKPPHKT